MKVEEIVEETVKKTVGKSKNAKSAHVYLPAGWAGREVLVCLLPKAETKLG